MNTRPLLAGQIHKPIPNIPATPVALRAPDVNRPAVRRLAGQKLDIIDGFGAPGGFPINNKASILPATWKALGETQAPDFAVYVFGPAGGKSSPFGHLAIAYRDAHGVLQALNIANDNKPHEKMVNFLKVEDHLYGVDSGQEQGGVYNRDVAMLALWGVPKKPIEKIVADFRKLARQEELGEVAFGAAGGKAWNTTRRLARSIGRLLLLTDSKVQEDGNCVHWPAKFMQEAGLIDEHTIFPKELFALTQAAADRDPKIRSKVVVFDSPEHCQRTTGDLERNPDNTSKLKRELKGWTSLNPITNYKLRSYKDLATYADAWIKVPRGSIRAEIKTARS
ncbi:MAG: hypothetical protein R3C68_13140 [Myxococcota bacterium]